MILGNIVGKLYTKILRQLCIQISNTRVIAPEYGNWHPTIDFNYKRLLPFGVNIVYYDLKRMTPEMEDQLGITYYSLDDLLGYGVCVYG